MNLLLHLCCANCAIYPLKVLRSQGANVTGFFFNHNIHPYQEFRRRLDAVHQYVALADLPTIFREDYLLEEFLSRVAHSPPSRCEYCYASRLEQTAREASERGFSGFSTTLLYSRYQQQDRIRAHGEQLAVRYGIPFIYQDFREGWNEGIAISKTLGLYRQQYCGCIFSEKERYAPREKG
jgi:epoxyqueuosine reductase